MRGGKPKKSCVGPASRKVTRPVTRFSSPESRHLMSHVPTLNGATPHAVEKIGRYSEEHHEPFEAFLDSRSAKSDKDGWTLPEVNVAFQKYINETRRFDERRPDLTTRQMGLLLDARSRQKPPRGEASRFVKEDSKWYISPPKSYREDRTLPPGKTLISRKEKARLEALAAQVPSAVAPSRSAAGRAAQPAATTDTTRPEAKTPAEIINDAMKPPAEAAVWKAKSDYPYEAKVAIVESLVGNSGISQRQFQDTFAAIVTAFCTQQYHALGRVLLDPSSPESAVRAIAALPRESRDNIRNALDAVDMAPPSGSQATALEAARVAHQDVAVAAVAPCKSSLTNWTRQVGRVADLQCQEELNREGGCLVADADSDQKKKILHVGYTRWDPTKRLVNYEYLGGLPNGGTAEENKMAFDHLIKKKNAEADGHASDSAGDMGTGLLKEMRGGRPGWYGCGCFLHVMSKGSEVGFDEAFGKAEANVPGVQRLYFIVHYLIIHNKKSFIHFCVVVLKIASEDVHIPALGEKGRWWSMYQASGDIDRECEIYYRYFIFKSNDSTESNTFRKLFKEVASWLKNKTIMAQNKFILCFHSAFWERNFQWALDTPEWMNDVPAVNKIGGCRAPEMVRKLIMMMRELDSLKGNFGTDPRFIEWQSAIASFGGQSKAVALEQAEIVREQFCLVVERMCGKGWLEEKVDSAIFDPIVGFTVASRLLSVYHRKTGKFAYLEPAAGESVMIDGAAVPLAELVADMTQFIVGKAGEQQLKKQSLFFIDPQTVALIERWVTNKLMPPELKLILEKKLYAMLVTSILAEHMVHEGNLFKRKYAPHQSDSVVSIQTELKLNATNHDATAAFEEFLRSAAYERAAPMRAGASRSWRRKGKTVTQTANGTRNKSMVLLKVKRRRERSCRVDKATEARARNHAKRQKSDGADDAGAVASKSKRREAKAARKRGTMKKVFTAAAAAAGAASHEPSLTSAVTTGGGSYLDLAKTTKKAGFGAPYEKRIVAAELDARPRGDGKQWYETNSNGEPKPTMAALVALLKAANGGCDRVLRKGDPKKDAKATRWRRDGAAVNSFPMSLNSDSDSDSSSSSSSSSSGDSDSSSSSSSSDSDSSDSDSD